jgi:hypothetical protein
MSSSHGLLGDDRPLAVADRVNGVVGIIRRHDGGHSALSPQTTDPHADRHSLSISITSPMRFQISTPGPGS